MTHTKTQNNFEFYLLGIITHKLIKTRGGPSKHLHFS